jgi:hypothetical protein
MGVIMAVISRPNGAAVVVVMCERYRYARGSACARPGGRTGGR